jgi:hypothetical protein
MADIFISYASQDRPRAQTLAQGLGALGWSVWWDREIPLGKSFDEVIEKELKEARCAVVLWSAASVASEWVRNEASEAKRRDILIPVFLDAVEAPLAFRLVNGADLRDWSGDPADAEFERLVERIGELLAQGPDTSRTIASSPESARTPSFPEIEQARRSHTPLIVATAVVVVGAALVLGYWLGGEKSALGPEPGKPATSLPANSAPGLGGADMEKNLRELIGSLGTLPGTSVAKGFHVPDLGWRVAYLTPEQSASTLGALPPGAVVMEVESGRPAARAGMQVGDVILSIAGKKIASENDLRQAIFKIGPGKTTYTYRRDRQTNSATIDCPGCKAE